PLFLLAGDGIRRLHVTGVQTCALPTSIGYIAKPPSCHRCASVLKNPPPSVAANTGKRLPSGPIRATSNSPDPNDRVLLPTGHGGDRKGVGEGKVGVRGRARGLYVRATG